MCDTADTRRRVLLVMVALPKGCRNCRIITVPIKQQKWVQSVTHPGKISFQATDFCCVPNVWENRSDFLLSASFRPIYTCDLHEIDNYVYSMTYVFKKWNSLWLFILNMKTDNMFICIEIYALHSPRTAVAFCSKRRTGHSRHSWTDKGNSTTCSNPNFINKKF